MNYVSFFFIVIIENSCSPWIKGHIALFFIEMEASFLIFLLGHCWKHGDIFREETNLYEGKKKKWKLRWKVKAKKQKGKRIHLFICFCKFVKVKRKDSCKVKTGLF